MSSGSELPPLFEEFPPVSTDAWMAKIREDLGTSDLDEVLTWDSIDGISLPAFGRREDLTAIPHVDEAATSSPLVDDDAPANRWRVRQDLGHADPDAAGRLAKQAVQGGVTDLGLRATAPDASPSGVVETPTDLRTVLADVPFGDVNLHLERGPAALVLLTLLRRAVDRSLSDLLEEGTVAYDPVGALAIGAVRDETRAFDGLEALLAEDLPDGLRFVHVDLRPYHQAGASAVQELAYGLGALSETLAHGLDRGYALSALLPRLHVTTAASTSYFVEIAKLRALRLLAPQVIDAFADEVGASVDVAPADLFLQVETSSRSETLYDPHTNMLRATTEAMAAVLGGGDVLNVPPFDRRHRSPERFGMRIARNVQHILRHEAHFDTVADPAAGSYYVEAATDALAERAWADFQALEAQGGLLDALREEAVQSEIAAVREERQNAVDRGDRVLVGTTHYPDLSESRLDDQRVTSRNNGTPPEVELDDLSIEALDGALSQGHSAAALVQGVRGGSPAFSPLPSARIAEGIEAVRLRTERYASEHHRPVAVLAPLGPPGPRSARATFARHVFGVAGFDVREHLGFDRPEAAVAAAVEAEADLLVVCSADREYADLVPAVRSALADRALDPLLVVAGDPDQMPGTVSADAFVHRGRPLREMLVSVQRRLGIGPDAPASA